MLTFSRSAVDRYFVKEMIKTPKNLDTPNVFDFLGFPPPGTPRSAKMYRDLSPNRILDYHPTRDHLSPRLSPRFPILDTPTDLSNRPALPLVRVHDGGENNEAEDLSTKSKSTQSHPPMSPPPTPPQVSSLASFHRHASASPPPHPIKVEYRSVSNYFSILPLHEKLGHRPLSLKILYIELGFDISAIITALMLKI